MKATEQYFPVVLFIMLYKVVLTFLNLRPSKFKLLTNTVNRDTVQGVEETKQSVSWFKVCG